MHSIFKIGISQNMKCAYMVGFLKYSHIHHDECDNFLQIYLDKQYNGKSLSR